MKLLAFGRSDRDPIVESNRLTKSLRINQSENGFIGEASSFYKPHGAPLPFLYNDENSTHIYNYSEVVTDPEQFRKSPGK